MLDIYFFLINDISIFTKAFSTITDTELNEQTEHFLGQSLKWLNIRKQKRVYTQGSII